MIENQQKCQTSMSNIEKNQSPRIFFLWLFWTFGLSRLLAHFSLSIVVMLSYLFSQETVEALLLFREYNEKAVDLWRQERN